MPHLLKMQRSFLDVYTKDFKLGRILEPSCGQGHLVEVLKEYDKLQKAGYSIPKDVSIVGYDNYLFAHPFAEQITTYNVDMEQMAKAAVKILIKKIKGSDRHQGIKYIDSSIVERNSVRRI